ncbi:chemotaxis-specific methylesterase [Rubripirellula tenax]|uniref:Chemotaxis-specific methylesterase n=1 Tax=Rubripirellula tenax TaxID=2528015 RepID=A0A5C6EE16_9BACT|nr:response regulator [Rubripirellula tenax]TWU46237.1 chemotaxis-specific methylesterase [Rubripirellula tenax]
MQPNLDSQAKPIRRVMLVDDDGMDNFLHSRSLKNSGLVDDIIVFEEPEAALQYLRQSASDIDLICLDINMPRMNGFEFITAFETLWDSNREKPLILILSTSVGEMSAEYVERIPRLIGAEPKPLNRELIQRLSREHF